MSKKFVDVDKIVKLAETAKPSRKNVDVDKILKMAKTEKPNQNKATVFSASENPTDNQQKINPIMLRKPQTIQEALETMPIKNRLNLNDMLPPAALNKKYNLQLKKAEQNESKPETAEQQLFRGTGASRSFEQMLPDNSSKPGKENFLSWLGKHVMSGLGKANEQVFSTLDFLLPTEVLGDFDFVSKLNDYYAKNDKDLSARAEQSSEAMGGNGWKTAGNITQDVTAALPNALLALMTAGSSLSGNAAVATSQTLESAAALANGLTSTAATAVSQMLKNPLYWSSFMQTTGNSYEDALDDGASELAATATALISGFVNSGVEIGGGLETLPNELRGGKASTILKWVRSMLDEGKEEVVQGVVEQATRKFIYDQDKKWASLSDENAVLNPIRAGKEFAGGATVGGILGGAQIGADALINAMSNRTAGQMQQTEPMGLSLPGAEDTTQPAQVGTAATKQQIGQLETPAREAETAGLLSLTGTDSIETETPEPEGMLTLPGDESIETAVPETVTPENIDNGGIQNVGEKDTGGDGGRLSGIGTGEQAGGMAESTAGSRVGKIQSITAANRSGKVTSLQAERTSAQKLGLKNGDTAEVLTVIPDSFVAEDEELNTVSNELTSDGFRVTYFIGRAKPGMDSDQAVDAWISGTDMYIRADSARYSVTHLSKHEKFHNIAENDPGLVSKIADDLQGLGDTEINGIIEKYIDKYRGLIDMDGEDAEPRLLEEIFADAYAGINKFKAGATKYSDTVKNVTEMRSGSPAEREAQKKEVPTEGQSGELILPGDQKEESSAEIEATPETKENLPEEQNIGLKLPGEPESEEDEQSQLNTQKPESTSKAQKSVSKAKTKTKSKKIASVEEESENNQENKISDFGEKIGGARKDLWKERGLMVSDLSEMNDAEAGKYVTKDNVWNKINYEKLVEDGVTRDAAFYIKTVRDSLPVSPQILRSDKTQEDVTARREQYIEFVRSVQDVLSEIKTKDDALKAFDRILVKQGYYTERGWSEKAYENPQITNKFTKALRVTERSWNYDIIRKMEKTQFLVPTDKKLPGGVQIRLFDGQGYYREEVWETGTYYITKGNSILAVNFSSEDSARKWVQDNLTKTGKSGKQRFVPQQLEAIHRTGLDYRDNNTRDITGENYLDTFGFRGGEFGNWVNQNERQVSLNYGYDALMDLTDALGIDEFDISLGSKLAIAFGARGQGSAAAHFEPLREVINLTKMQGAGSLAHEWAHALDYIFGKELGAAESMIKNKSAVGLESLSTLIRDLKYKPDNAGNTDFYKNSREFDKQYAKETGAGYWSSDEEMFARAFACYVTDKLKASDTVSDYLSGHSESAIGFTTNDKGEVDILKAIPEGEERARLNNDFDALISELKERGLLHERDNIETGYSVVKYSLEDGDVGETEDGRLLPVEPKLKENVFTYENLIKKPDMKVTVLNESVPRNLSGKIDRRAVVDIGMQNVRDISGLSEMSSPTVYVKDVDADVHISNSALRHGLDRRVEQNALVLLRIGDVLKNSVVINEMDPDENGAEKAYLLLGAAQSEDGNIYGVTAVVNQYPAHDMVISSLHVLYSTNAKIIEPAAVKARASGESALSLTGSKISIANLLNYVKEKYSDILPEDVLKFFGKERADTKLGRNVRYSVDDKIEGQAKYKVAGDSLTGYNDLKNTESVSWGYDDKTYTENNTAVNFTYAIVPASNLITSNDQFGSINEKYPFELQPRDRKRQVSQLQIQNISRNLNPRLLADSPTAQNGAPIVRGDGVVIGGNARTQALISAYHNETADSYRSFIRDRAGRFGIDTANLPKDPVLVRVVKASDNWAALARELNESTTAAYSATENSFSDAKKMSGVLDSFVPNDDGRINTRENSDFISRFMSEVVPEADRGNMLTASGFLSQSGLERARNAIFAAAYNDAELSTKLTEYLDDDIKNVTNALVNTAPNALAIRRGIESGDLYDINLVDDVVQAVRLYEFLKRSDITMTEYLEQLSLSEDYSDEAKNIAQFIEKNKRSGKQITTFFNMIYNRIDILGDPNQELLLGGERYEYSKQNVLASAAKAYTEETGNPVGFQTAAIQSGIRGEAERGSKKQERRRHPSVTETGEAWEETVELKLPTIELKTEPAARTAVLIPSSEQEDISVAKLPGAEPEDIETESIQSMIPAGMTIDEYTAQLTVRAEAAKAARLRNIPKSEFLGSPALEKLGVRIEGSVADYSGVESLRQNDAAAKSVQRELKKAERRLNASAAEKEFASGIAAGVYTENDIPHGMDTDKVMELADYYMAERAMGIDQIRQRRRDINRNLDEKMEELFKDSDKYKPSKSIVLNNRTPQRNMLQIFGDKQGAKINAEIFDPVAVNEAERYRFTNRQLNQVRAFTDSRGRRSKLTKDERAVVQQVMEGRAAAEAVAGMEMSVAIKNAAENVKNGKDLDDSAREFSLNINEKKLAEKYARWLATKEVMESGDVDIVKIENAVKQYTELFNQYYDGINDFLVVHGYEPIGFIKGYAPHLQPEENRNILVKSLQSLGINTDVTRLPSSIAGLTADYRPNKKWNPYFLTRSSDVTDYDIASAFESYVNYMSDVLYHTDDIMQVRRATNYFRRTYAPDEISEAISHAENLRYATTEEKADLLHDAGKLSRASSVSANDVSSQMDDYINELYEDIKKVTKYSDFVSYLDNYANILAGKQSMADRGWEYAIGREGLNIGNRLTRAFARAQIAGNISSALNQMAQIPQILSENGLWNTIVSMSDLMSGKLRRAGFSEESDFLTGKSGINYIVNTPSDMILNTLFTPAQFMDKLTATLAVRGAYLRAVSSGAAHAEAMKAADKFGAEVMASRMKGSRPLAFESKNPVSQMLHIFQTEALNSWEHIYKDLPRDFRKIEQEHGREKAAAALAGVIVKMLLSAFLLNRLTEELYGGTPVPFDVLGLSSNFIASGEGLSTNQWIRTMLDNGWEQLTGERLFGTDTLGERDFDFKSALEDLGYNISNDIPFIRNAAGLLGWGDETLPIPLGDMKGDIEKVISAAQNSGPLSPEMLEAMGGIATQFIPGGRQINKTLQGMKTMAEAGRAYGYGEKERLQYPVDNSWSNWLQTALFGNAGLNETEEYYASGLSGLTAGQTKAYRELVDGGADGITVYDTIQGIRSVSSNDSMDAAEKARRKRDIIEAANLTDSEKASLYSGIISDSRDDDFSAMMDAGMTWVKIMDAYNQYADLNGTENMTAAEKALKLAKWADNSDFSASQAALVKDQFRFYSVVPAEAKRYSNLTSAGLSSDAAYNLTDTFSKLKPEDGKDAVSNLQKYRAVIDSGISEKDQISALTTLMQDAEICKVETGYNYGVTPAQYVTALENISEIDTNNSVTQAEAQQAIDHMPELSVEQQAVLWQIQNKSWSAERNPYSVGIGEEVRAVLQRGTGKDTEEFGKLTLPSL